MTDSRLGAILALFDGVSDGVCVADAKGDVLYMNAAARKLLEMRGRGPMLPNACELICGKLELREGVSAEAGCPLRANAGEVQAVTFLGRHGPHATFNWQADRVARSQGWKDLRVRCVRSKMNLAELEQEIHLVFLENAAPEMELKRHRADWRNMVAHDLRSPLTSIFAALRLLEDLHTDAPPDGDDARLVKTSLAACRKMMELLDLYLDIAQLDAEAKSPRLEDLELRPIADFVLQEQAALAAVNGVRLSCDIPAGLKARGDSELLERVLQNLVNNAIKYNQPGGTVLVDAKAGPAGVLLSVTDTGRGVAATELPFLFDRYYQADARRAGRIKGNGLGLTFCKEAVSLMGGTIEAESEEGKGCVFRIGLAPVGGSS